MPGWPLRGATAAPGRVRHPSLRRRLLVGLVLVTFGYWIAVTWLTVQDSAEEVNQLFDAHLAQTALALLRVTDPDETDPVHVPTPPSSSAGVLQILGDWPAPLRPLTQETHAESGETGAIPSLHAAYERSLRYQVFARDGDLIMRSANAPERAMTALDGYSESRDAQDRAWRHYAVWDQHGDFRIVVSESHELRHGLVRGIVMHLARPLAWGLPVLVVLVWWSIGRGLVPLRTLARQIKQRRADNLTPLDIANVPREVHALVRSLNALLGRVTHALDSERRFTADAAHELRTPLAALQAHLHVARMAEEEAERCRGFEQLQLGVSRSIRVVSQMLALARLDPAHALPDLQPVDLAEVAQAACAELAPLALQRHQRLELQVDDGPSWIAGQADMLAMLLCNLVDNAIRYTPEGGRIEVTVRRAEGYVVAEVADDGPGIPQALRERVFDRFFRVAGHEQPGTGLGLTICRRVAELHAARVTLQAGPTEQGLVAEVRFVAAHAPRPA